MSRPLRGGSGDGEGAARSSPSSDVVIDLEDVSSDEEVAEALRRSLRNSGSSSSSSSDDGGGGGGAPGAPRDPEGQARRGRDGG